MMTPWVNFHPLSTADILTSEAWESVKFGIFIALMVDSERKKAELQEYQVDFVI